MATPAKRWPNNAEWARMDSIVLLDEIIKINRQTSDDDKADVPSRLRASKTIDRAYQAIRKLQSVGKTEKG